MIKIKEIINLLKSFNFNPEYVVTSEEFIELFKEVKKEYPLVKLVKDFEEGLYQKANSVLCIADLSLIKGHESKTDLDFEGYLKLRQSQRDEPLESIYNASLILKEGGEVIIYSPKTITHEDNVKKVMLCCKFQEVEVVNEKVVKGRKRKLIKYEFDRGRQVLEEAQEPELIEKVLDFCERFYKGEGYNYRKEIDRLFVKHSDYFVAYKKEGGEIQAVARHIWQLPGHYLPLMLAEKVDDGEHVELEEPDENHYGEFAGVYLLSFSGGKAYKEVMGNVFKYVINTGLDKIAFTTYLKNDIKTRELYVKNFGFDCFITELIYGDFGGIWVLLKGEKEKVIISMNEFIGK